MKDVSVKFVGINYANSKIWGFMSIYSIYGPKFYTFWGKNNNLYFKFTPDDAKFRKNVYKKTKKYTKIAEDGFKEQFEEFMILKKLKNERL